MKKLIPVAILCVVSLIANSQISYKWAKSMGGPPWDQNFGSHTDGTGNVYSTGWFAGTVDFDPGPGVANLSTGGASSAFPYVLKLDSNGNYLWAKLFLGSSEGRGNTVTTDAAGNVFAAGYYNFILDADPGPGTHNLNAIGEDFYVIKLDPSGNFVWAISIGGGTTDQSRTIKTDAAGNVYITGFFEDVADFDPGPGTYSLTANAQNPYFILKLDNNGNFGWVKTFGWAATFNGKSLVIDNVGNLYCAGNFSGTIDFDPGASTHNLVSTGSQDVFALKLDASGNFVWARSFGGTSADYGNAITVDGAGNAFVAGTFSGTADLDPGAGTANVTSNGAKDFFLVKLDASGNFVWGRSAGGATDDEGISTAVNLNGDVFVTGVYSGTADFDPGAGTSNLTSTVNGRIFLQKLDVNGDFLWAAALGGTGIDIATDVMVDVTQNVVLAGYFDGTEDFDPTPNTNNLVSNGNMDIFIVKLAQHTCALLPLAVDSVLDIDCGTDTGYAYVHAQHGTPPYLYEWNTTPAIMDSTGKFASPGIYTITATDANNCALSTSILINGPASQTGFDLNANMSTSRFTSALAGTIWVNAFNTLCTPTSGQLILVLDTLVHYTGASIPPSVISGDTLTWNFTGINYNSPHLQPEVYFVTDTHAVNGTAVCFQLMITPVAGDANPVNNTKTYCYQVQNPYDPNFKEVYPQGSCTENYVMKNEPLTYTLHFQNTGSAPAINVHVMDTISAHMDITTVKVVGSSHAMYTEVLSDSILDFIFDDINLPDSLSNEPESHGYVIFEIMPVTGKPNGTVVENSCGIYFDFNAPVITNDVMNTLTDVIPQSAGTAVITSCGPYKWIDGKTYSTDNNSALYRMIGGATNLCDSVIALDLTVNDVDVDVTVSGHEITANTSGATYRWLDCNDNYAEIAGETAQIFTATANGDYAVEVTDNGCTDTSACVSITTIGIKISAAFMGVSIYPNPANDIVNVKLGDLKNVTVRVLDLKGQVIHEQKNINSPLYSFPFDKKPGIYQVEINAKEESRLYKLVQL